MNLSAELVVQSVRCKKKMNFLNVFPEIENRIQPRSQGDWKRGAVTGDRCARG